MNGLRLKGRHWFAFELMCRSMCTSTRTHADRTHAINRNESHSRCAKREERVWRSTRSLHFSATDLLTYERIADNTLHQLCDELERVIEESDELNDCDISLSDGVLTMNLKKHGVYVINKQTPNKQIWLSSPISGPKRYDYVSGRWIYKHDCVSLHDLLSTELSRVLNRQLIIKFIDPLIS